MYVCNFVCNFKISEVVEMEDFLKWHFLSLRLGLAILTCLYIPYKASFVTAGFTHEKRTTLVFYECAIKFVKICVSTAFGFLEFNAFLH